MHELEPVLPPDASAILQAERLQYSHIDDYLDAIVEEDADNLWLKHMKDLALLVEPKDPILGSDPEYSIGNAFFRGSLIGFRVVKVCTVPEVEKKMFQVNVGVDNDEPDVHTRLRIIANSILSCGERGFYSSAQLQQLIREWEDELEPQVVFQPFVHRGFGVMMYLMQEANNMMARESIQKAANSGVDWDRELQNLMDER